MIERLLNSELLMRMIEKAVWWAEDFRDAHPRLCTVLAALALPAIILAAGWVEAH